MEIEEVQRRAGSGPLVLLGRRAFAVLISILNTVTIPHLIGSKAYGLSAMSAVVFSLADMFKDFGLSSAILRKGHVSPQEVSFLFWFNMFTTLTLSILLAIASPFAGIFFHQPSVTWIILVSLIGFVIGGVSLQHRSLLSRDLRFKELAAIDSFTLLLQFVITLVLAAIRHDVWAIVIGSVCSGAVNGLLTVTVSRWVPSRPKLIAEAKAIFSFGANTSIFALCVFVSTNIVSILIGRVSGVYELGQFNRANALLSLPMYNAVEPIAQATLPVLARMRPHPELYRRTYLGLVRKLNLIVLPISIVLAFSARPIVETILGAKWREAGDLLAILSPAIAGLGFGYAIGDLFITQDRSAELRTIGLVEVVVRVIAISIGVYFSVYAAAFAYSVATISAVCFRVYVAGRKGPVTIKDHLLALAPTAPVALGVTLGCVFGLCMTTMLALPVVSRAILICCSGGVAGGLIGIAVPSSREALIEIAVTLHIPGSKRLTRSEA